MAKDVITRFKLETTAFDSKIKQASKELSDYSKTATKAKEGFNQFTKSNVDAARALGTMATSSNNLKGKLQELVGAYNEGVKAYKALSDEHKKSDWAKALAGSLTTLQQRIKDTKQELQGMSDTMKSSGLFGGGKFDGMLQVFGGNIMTKAAGFAASFASEIGSCVQQGIELARQGEGIRNAFERLGHGDILDGLREATHGTVTDLELMKAAVKFNDFKLPVEELGTMLAFAQQKAKDTGQSVDYMVDSIVTGLGRKSLMILDNLGLSAAEIKDKMKQTGDMTKAVGAIVREQMAKAGDYVETAADRAAQANVSLQNKMEELGRKFAPVEEASNQLWTSMKIGILDIIGGPLARLINGLTEAGRLKNALNDINAGNGGETKVEKALRILREYSGGGKGIEGKKDLYNRQMELYSANETKDWRNYNRLVKAEASYRNRMYERGQNAGDQSVLDNFAKQIENARNRALAWQQMAAQYEQGAKGILNPTASSTITPTNTDPKKTKEELDELQKIQKKIADLTKEAYTADDDRISAIQKEIAGYQEQEQKLIKIRDLVTGKSEMKGLEIVDNFNTGSVSIGQSIIDKVNADLAQANIDADVSTLQTLLNTIIKNGIEGVDIPTDELMEKIIGDGTNIPDEYWQKLQDEINAKLAEIGIEPIKINFKTGNLEKVVKDTKTTTKEWHAAATAISAVGNAMNQIEDPAAKVLGTIAQAVATMALSYSQAAASPAVTGTGWGWIAFAATGVATMISSIEAIKNATSGFASGGIIPGNSFSGDNLRGMTPDGNVFGLNAGEVVLNASQQNNLAQNLQGGGLSNLQLETMVDAEELIFVLNNNAERRGYGRFIDD